MRITKPTVLLTLLRVEHLIKCQIKAKTPMPCGEVLNLRVHNKAHKSGTYFLNFLNSDHLTVVPWKFILQKYIRTLKHYLLLGNLMKNPTLSVGKQCFSLQHKRPLRYFVALASLALQDLNLWHKHYKYLCSQSTDWLLWAQISFLYRINFIATFQRKTSIFWASHYIHFH